MHPSLRNVVVSGLFVHGAMLFLGFGTACNVTGDGAIAVVVNKIFRKRPVAV